MKEIVEKTGLSKGAFYHYFTSKEELYKEIFGMIISMGDIQYQTFPKDSLKKFYEHYLQHTEASTDQLKELFGDSDENKISFNFFLIMFESMTKFPEFMTMEFEEYKRGVEAWCQVIQTAKESGEIKSVSGNESIANLFLHNTDGSFIRYLNHPEFNGTYIDYLKDTFDTIYNNLKA